jgi:hypothetical protein
LYITVRRYTTGRPAEGENPEVCLAQPLIKPKQISTGTRIVGNGGQESPCGWCKDNRMGIVLADYAESP